MLCVILQRGHGGTGLAYGIAQEGAATKKPRSLRFWRAGGGQERRLEAAPARALCVAAAFLSGDCGHACILNSLEEMVANVTGIKRIGAGVSTVLVLGVSVVSFSAGAHRGKNTPAALASRAPVQNTPALCGQAYVGRLSGKRPSVSPGRPSARAGMVGEFQRQSALVLGYSELVEQHPAVFVDIIAGLHTLRLD